VLSACFFRLNTRGSRSVTESATGDARTALFARYSLVGALSTALDALAAGLPDWIAAHAGIAPLMAMRAMFIV
jgi:hypothetical protein